MNIQFKWWDGQGDPEDPKTGTPGVTSLDLMVVLRGQVVSGIGGVSQDSETFTMNFSQGAALWFTAAGGIPRVLIKRK